MCSMALVRELDFDMNISHIFPQGVLTAITLLGGWAIERVARTGARSEPGLALCSVAVTTVSGVGSGSKLLKQKP